MSNRNSDDSEAPSPLLPAELLARLQHLAQQPAPQAAAKLARAIKIVFGKGDEG